VEPLVIIAAIYLHVNTYSWTFTIHRVCVRVSRVNSSFDSLSVPSALCPKDWNVIKKGEVERSKGGGKGAVGLWLTPACSKWNMIDLCTRGLTCLHHSWNLLTLCALTGQDEESNLLWLPYGKYYGWSTGPPTQWWKVRYRVIIGTKGGGESVRVCTYMCLCVCPNICNADSIIQCDRP
jgi:hypothetical protein